MPILCQLSVITTVEYHRHVVLAQPDVELDTFDLVLNCSPEVRHAVIRAKVATTVSHDNCLSCRAHIRLSSLPFCRFLGFDRSDLSQQELDQFLLLLLLLLLLLVAGFDPDYRSLVRLAFRIRSHL